MARKGFNIEDPENALFGKNDRFGIEAVNKGGKIASKYLAWLIGAPGNQPGLNGGMYAGRNGQPAPAAERTASPRPARPPAYNPLTGGTPPKAMPPDPAKNRGFTAEDAQAYIQQNFIPASGLPSGKSMYADYVKRRDAAKANVVPDKPIAPNPIQTELAPLPYVPSASPFANAARQAQEGPNIDFVPLAEQRAASLRAPVAAVPTVDKATQYREKLARLEDQKMGQGGSSAARKYRAGKEATALSEAERSDNVRLRESEIASIKELKEMEARRLANQFDTEIGVKREGFASDERQTRMRTDQSREEYARQISVAEAKEKKTLVEKTREKGDMAEASAAVAAISQLPQIQGMEDSRPAQEAVKTAVMAIMADPTKRARWERGKARGFSVEKMLNDFSPGLIPPAEYSQY